MPEMHLHSFVENEQHEFDKSCPMLKLRLQRRGLRFLTSQGLRPCYPAPAPLRVVVGLQQHKRTQLDRLYQKIVDDLDELLYAVGLNGCLKPQCNENKIPVTIRSG
jgi:hypothetical protein